MFFLYILIFKFLNKINTFKYHVFFTDGKISVRINLPLFSTVVPSIIIIIDGTTVENKGK